MFKLIFLAFISFFIYLAVMTDISLAGASKKDKMSEKTNEALNATIEYTHEQKEEFQAHMKMKLDSVHEEIIALKSKMNKAKSKVSENLKDKIEELEKKEKSLQNDLESMKTKSDKAWGHMKNGMSKAWDEFSDSYQKAKDEYQKAN